MTKIFLDTEFIDNGKTLELISIGLVKENGDEYYAINREFNPKNASQWVNDNVLNQLPSKDVNITDHSISPRIKSESLAWKTRKQIRRDIIEFCSLYQESDSDPEFWADYASYDWVVFSQIFGTMMDLPKNYPMYCKDLRQELDRAGLTDKDLPKQKDSLHHALHDARWNRDVYHSFY